MSMYQSPRIRRLRNDFTALDRLRSESSVFLFQSTGNPPHQYQITYKGKGLWRDRGKVKVIHTHRVEIKLGASYPRTIPEIRWLTPIYHPNISEIGMVCLGGYGTHWVPSVQLDELCTMLWDMARYHNYDIRSPYNRDAALWVANQTSILFPTDARPLRDLRAAQGRIETANGHAAKEPSAANGRRGSSGNRAGEPRSAVVRVLQFIERYGKVFAEGPPPPLPGEAGASEHERAPLPLASNEPVADTSTTADVEPRAPSPSSPSVGDASATGDAEPAAPSPMLLPEEASTARDLPPIERSSAQEEVVILDVSSELPRHRVPPRMPADEDIVFID
jgi:ubiquitin-protein ligase